ncbi:MAG TPA: hypothetical protein VHV77_00095 [Pirellulales bacterium]|nr:hypothetical protein [Pirellulales bacterium]
MRFRWLTVTGLCAAVGLASFGCNKPAPPRPVDEHFDGDGHDHHDHDHDHNHDHEHGKLPDEKKV